MKFDSLRYQIHRTGPVIIPPLHDKLINAVSIRFHLLGMDHMAAVAENWILCSYSHDMLCKSFGYLYGNFHKQCLGGAQMPKCHSAI